MEFDSNSKQVITFYLPQFHTIPENDKWWGKGFTEWTNTKKARPLFEGHEQPKTPLHNNYYDLSDVTVMEGQAKLAKSYGVSGFCYYHYWFKNGKKLLEKPIEQMLVDKNVDIPFCLCWANENWSRNWDGGNCEVIMEQDYGLEKEWIQHFMYLLPFFKDERYITFQKKPVLVIYKPEEINHYNEMRACFEKLAVKEGFNGLLILSQYPSILFDKRPAVSKMKIDYFIKFEPMMTEIGQKMEGKNNRIRNNIKAFLPISWVKKYKKIKDNVKFKSNIKHDSIKPIILDYDETWKYILNCDFYGKNIINGGFTAWDNTARKHTGVVFQGSTPEKFEKYMKQLLKKDSGLNLVFVNAWNEWAEGAYLEPDERYEYGYLEALKRAVDSQIDI